jgi:hypothetical protein
LSVTDLQYLNHVSVYRSALVRDDFPTATVT